jgi:hypothetical protein
MRKFHGIANFSAVYQTSSRFTKLLHGLPNFFTVYQTSSRSGANWVEVATVPLNWVEVATVPLNWVEVATVPLNWVELQVNFNELQ